MDNILFVKDIMASMQSKLTFYLVSHILHKWLNNLKGDSNNLQFARHLTIHLLLVLTSMALQLLQMTNEIKTIVFLPKWCPLQTGQMLNCSAWAVQIIIYANSSTVSSYLTTL